MFLPQKCYVFRFYLVVGISLRLNEVQYIPPKKTSKHPCGYISAEEKQKVKFPDKDQKSYAEFEKNKIKTEIKNKNTKP